MKKIMSYVCRVLPAFLIGTFIITSMSGLSVTYALEIIFREEEPDIEPAPIYTSGDYGYQFNADEETITIAEYTGSEDVLEVPSQIDGYTVTEIGEQAFYSMDLTSLIIPEGIIMIGPRAFEYCTITDSLQLPSGVTVCRSAFSYAKLPSMVTIPEGVLLQGDSFSYCDRLEILVVESGTIISGQAFSYSKKLKDVVCESGSTVQDRAFEYCETLKDVYLCGDVEMNGDPVQYCDSAEIIYAEEQDFAELPAMLTSISINGQDDGKDDTTGKEADYYVGDMGFCVPWMMMDSSMAGYDLFLIDTQGRYIVGAALMPASSVNFENDDEIQVLLQSVPESITVDGYYKVKICGYPGLWLSIHSTEDNVTGAYLYFTVDDSLYYLMFVNAESDSLEGFIETVHSITIEGNGEGTDISVVTE